MSSALEQSDVDALMDAVEADELPGPPAAPQIFSRFRRSFENVEIRPYDFKRPERITKEQVRALHTLHENFARAFGASISGFLRTIVEVRVGQVEQMTWSEFIAALPNPTSFNLIDAPQLGGRMCLELSPLVVYPIIDRLLGGSSAELFIPQREMTGIETRLIQAVLERAAEAFREAWTAVRPIDFALAQMETNPQIVQIVPPNEVVVVIGFEVRLAGRAGTMSLCMPFKLIEPVVGELSAQSWSRVSSAGPTGRLQGVVGRRIAAAALPVTGILARTTITMSELAALEPGDVITTDRPASAPVVLAAGGRPKFLAVIGQHKGRRALRIIRAIAPGDRRDAL